VAHGRWKAEVLLAVLRLDLPAVLTEEPQTAASLARKVGADPDALSRLLVLAAALDLCGCVDGSFAASEATAALAGDGGVAMQTECLHVLSDWGRTAWASLEGAVRTGQSGFASTTGMSVFDHLAQNPAEAATFHAFQAEVTRRNASALLHANVLPSSGIVVDVGGGTGTLLASLLSVSPDLAGIVFDRPEVVDQLGVPEPGARLTWVGGDFFDSSAKVLPRSADVYLLSHVLHDWADQDARWILQTVADAMAPHSRMLVLENVLQPASTNLLVSYLDVLMLTAWGSRERSVVQYGKLMSGAGLELRDERLLVPPTGLSVLTAQVSSSGRA